MVLQRQYREIKIIGLFNSLLKEKRNSLLQFHATPFGRLTGKTSFVNASRTPVTDLSYNDDRRFNKEIIGGRRHGEESYGPSAPAVKPEVS
ncbi:MAG TPA: hypothetical protein VLE19_07190 [Pyrinomonadaceae bacterium]|nr:hypothetical protein [Pyrinomonadaceae bacterium]